MRYESWLEFANHSARHEIKVAVTGEVYYTMYDWCIAYESSGVFYSAVSVDAYRGDYKDDAIGRGAFYFSDESDAVVFALKWTGINKVA